MKKRLFSALILCSLLIASCNLPAATTPASNSIEAAQTAAAQTVQAVLTAQTTNNDAQSTESGSSAPPATSAPQTTQPPTQAPTFTPPPTATPLPPDTATPRPCNQATFIADVTIPDGSELPPGDNFFKIWRLKNVGTCSWTTDYALVFDHGDPMSGPAVQQLTQIVNPGETVDIKVTLIAPDTAGDYRGYWKLRDANGEIFGLTNGNAFWVDIKVVPSAPTFFPITLIPTFYPITFTKTLSPSSRGQVYSDGQVSSSINNTGDVQDNRGLQGFLTFDLSDIPAGSTIEKVEIVITSYDTIGDPFGSLGCMRAYIQDYGTLDASDYFTGYANGSIARWCSGDVITAPQETHSTFASYIASHLGGTAQIRLQFNETETNNNNAIDIFRGHLQLIVYYH